MYSIPHAITFAASPYLSLHRSKHSSHHSLTHGRKPTYLPQTNRRCDQSPHRFTRNFHSHPSLIIFATQQLPSTVGHTIHHPTGTNIYIIGCVHGSKLSALDVEDVCNSNTPSAIVLELCGPRLRSLMLDMEQNEENKQTRSGLNKEKSNRWQFKNAVERFGGVGPAVLALGLLSMSGMQRVIGLDPGGEFKVGVKVAKDCGSAVVCGDVLGNETVKKLAKAAGLKGVAHGVQVILGILKKVGNGSWYFPEGRVRLEKVILDWRRMWELVWIVGPIVGMTYAVTAAVYLGANFLAGRKAVGLQGNMSVVHPVWWSAGLKMFEWLPIVWMVLASASFMQALVMDRDLVLARNISDACRVHGGKEKNIVAVVGLLHVNGVLRALEQSTFSKS